MARLRPGYIRISSGGYRRWIKANTVDQAFAKFLRSVKPKALGQLFEIYADTIDGPTYTAYASTEHYLRKMGRWSDE